MIDAEVVDLFVFVVSQLGRLRVQPVDVKAEAVQIQSVRLSAAPEDIFQSSVRFLRGRDGLFSVFVVADQFVLGGL